MIDTEAYFVKDLKSRNGTYLNGVPVEENGSALHTGDVLSLGRYGFHVFLDQTPDLSYLKDKPVGDNLPATKSFNPGETPKGESGFSLG